MRVGILGSGLMGGKLGRVLARAGHEVVFSYARSKAKLRGWRPQAAFTPTSTENARPADVRSA